MPCEAYSAAIPTYVQPRASAEIGASVAQSATSSGAARAAAASA